MINVTRKQMPTVYKAGRRKLMKNAVDNEGCWSRSRREPWYIRTQFIHSSKYNWDCRFPWRREPLARDVDKTVKMAEGPRCGAKGEGVPGIGKGTQSSMWSDLRLNSYLWFLYNVKDGKVIDDKSMDQSMESCKSRMLMWSMWPRISKWSKMPRMLSKTKNVEKPNVTKNGKNDQIYDMKLNVRVKKSYLLKYLIQLYWKLEFWTFQKFTFYYFSIRRIVSTILAHLVEGGTCCIIYTLWSI